MNLDSAVAVVTGATRGVGRGVARELARQGARVFMTGRSVPDHAPFDEPITAIRCDHRDDRQVDTVFDRIVREAETIDVLVNSVWGGYERMIDDGAFTWPKPFWEQPLWRWDAMFTAGVRAHYHASQLAARTMVAQRRGLIVNVSFWAAQKHLGNVSSRTREIGTHMALGAGAGRILWNVLAQGLRLVAIGIAVGGVLSWMLAQMLRGALAGLSPADPIAFGRAILVLTLTGIAAMRADSAEGQRDAVMQPWYDRASCAPRSPWTSA